MMHKFDPTWGSHLPVLIKCLENSKGPVLELGLGISSTPLLHALCFDQDRFLLSLDNDPQFVEMFKKYRSETHSIELVDNWATHPITPSPLWALALIDHKPEERRKEEIKRLADKAIYLIVHDTEPNNDLYHYEEIYPLFKFRYDYTKSPVHTTVLSNFHDLDFLRNP